MLGIPSDPAAAVRVAVEAQERLLDVASVGDSPFLGIASFGFDSDANRIANEAKWIRATRSTSTPPCARSRPGSRPVHRRVDGERHSYTGFSVAVGNSKAYGGGMFVLPQAELDDGKLDVIVSKQAPS